MPRDPSNRIPTEDAPYNVYGGSGRSGGGRKPPPASEEGLRRLEGRSGGRQGRSGGGQGRSAGGGAGPDYKVYRAGPRGLRERLRGEEGLEGGGGGGAGGGRIPRRDRLGPGGADPWWRRQLRPRRLLLWLVGLVVAWLLLSFVLFMVSAQQQSGSIPSSATAALTSGSNLLTGTDTVLVLGTDQRPKGTHEAGANTSDKGSRTDTIMLWRIGGGTSRRLSIPRDTLVNIPGYGQQKINAAYAIGGPKLAIQTIEQFTGVQINHLIIVNLANFPKFIDAIGGITVKTGRICSQISGGAANGGWTLDLRPGTHHLTGIQALVLARTRENTCNAASNDLTREAYQQKILNGIKSKLLSPVSFFHLPWASWYAPQAVRTDMGGLTLLQRFAAAEMG
ncbi:MAG TPA: LCP family protein, partial [Solirubrobacteraceae bacterium]|nr:LCP family protein [Solirubrobacteraceae bacterium]